MDIANNVKQALYTFCRMHGIDTDSPTVQEFYVAVLSELSGLACGRPGMAANYVAKHSEKAAVQ